MLNISDLKEKIIELGFPAYRAEQIYRSVCMEGITDYGRITTLPANIKAILSVKIPIYSIFPEHITSSPDGSAEKILFRLRDGSRIETVLMKFNDRRSSVCVSSQAGCRLGCKFCSTGKSGFSRNLNYEEIFDQVLFCQHRLHKAGKRINNVVFMGMGEPFMNYDNVIKSIRAINDKKGLNIGARAITVSTSGICEGIDRLAEEKIQVNLAVSLHAPNQALREKIMPIARKYDIKNLISSVRKYIQKTNRRVSYEYIMLKDINDHEKEARELIKLLKGQLCHINLIPYNATGIKGIQGSKKINIIKFRDIIKSACIPVTVRISLGQGIRAACGQLADKTSDRRPKHHK